jgi:hypothetical protein
MHPPGFREREAGRPPTEWSGAFLTDSCAGPNGEFVQQHLSGRPELATDFLQRRPPAPRGRPYIRCQVLSQLDTDGLFGASCFGRVGCDGEFSQLPAFPTDAMDAAVVFA